jgi:hypothetical protein
MLERSVSSNVLVAVATIFSSPTLTNLFSAIALSLGLRLIAPCLDVIGGGVLNSYASESCHPLNNALCSD